MRSYKRFLISISIFCQFGFPAKAQLVWPIGNNLNQINCTYAEIHTAFHRALDINASNSSLFFSPHDGRIFVTGSFIELKWDFQNNSNLSNLFKCRFGDNVTLINGLLAGDQISAGDTLGKITSGGHLHFEVWSRECLDETECPWKIVNPLNNPDTDLVVTPSGYNDTWSPEINDLILHPVNKSVPSGYGILSNNGGLQNFHENSVKIHLRNRVNSISPIFNPNTDKFFLY